MSKAIVTALVVGVVAMAGVLVGACSAGAAELLAQPMRPRGSRQQLVWPLRLPSRRLRLS